MTWILVLTLTTQSSYPGFAIQAIPGFTGLQECLDRGNDWLAQMKGITHSARALCMSQNK
jgi:hypothetical protein